eukprot:COSAG01_NODE_154_length_23851_cov_159.173999_6_plen_89_part_00
MSRKIETQRPRPAGERDFENLVDAGTMDAEILRAHPEISTLDRALSPVLRTQSEAAVAAVAAARRRRAHSAAVGAAVAAPLWCLRGLF